MPQNMLHPCFGNENINLHYFSNSAKKVRDENMKLSLFNLKTLLSVCSYCPFDDHHD